MQSVDEIAELCHEANRALCKSFGDMSQVPWEEAPAWQRDSAVSGVQFHLDTPTATASHGHEEWLRDKLAHGWVYGPTKNVETKEHPCIVPFDQLPPEQQAKDFIFRAIVHTAGRQLA